MSRPIGILISIALLALAGLSFAAEPEVTEVEIFKFKFLPQEITIKAGDKVRWTNKEKRQYHSVWFEQLGEPEPDYLFPGDTYERVFKETGDFPYRCGPHPEMTGIVHVE
ncbi:plastocyanin/azurin family copper-binding protein [Thiolapillus sp.]